WRLHELARLLANRAGEDSSTSSRPPSSDDPYRREERGKPVAADPDGAAADSSDTAPEKAGKPDQNKTAKGSGKQPGAKGHWRCQPIVVSAEVAHAPMVCAACGAALGPDLKRRCVSAHDSLELVRGDMALQVTATRHSYFAVRCPCGHDNVERPRVGLSSLIEGRKRNLRMTERCLVGPMLATFIGAAVFRGARSRNFCATGSTSNWEWRPSSAASTNSAWPANPWSSASLRMCEPPRSSISTKPPGI